ncbi:MAG: ABC transporter ATP-binding protein [Desulfobacterales bacterium]|nr:ABC transporter ATP-binding protein [Desulfobacterales bacterium]
MTASKDAVQAPLLRVENLGVLLQNEGRVVRVVDAVSFRLKQGETLGIVGESGCGKTLLCRSLLGLLPGCAAVAPDAKAFFDGKDLFRLSESSLNKVRAAGIAMIFQDPLSSLNPVMTIGRQICEPLVHHLGMTARKARSRAVELLHSVGVSGAEQRVDHYPHQMSGGMRQRVAIAIALSCGPKLLIADEPTTALDVTVQAAILDLLMRVQAGSKTGMILVTHDLRVAATRTHEVAVMYAGRIVERISAGALFTHMRVPYTRALVDAIPKMDRPPHAPLHAIEGRPPGPAGAIYGCAFAPRCDRAIEKCRARTPPMRSDRSGRHWYACWNPIQEPAP